MELPISLVVITLNEEQNIKRCIESARFCREVIVLDSESTDRTREIATELGAKVYTQKFLGYRQQKQLALEKATSPWILSLDADETLSSYLRKEIHKLFLKGPMSDAYRIPRCSYHLGRWIRHGGWYPDYQTRLFKKDKAQWGGGHVHESIEIAGTTASLKNDIHHFVFKSLEDQIDTNNEYSSQGALDLKNKGESFSLVKLVFKPLGKFLECYFWKRGFLDGAPGFIIALTAAQSLFLKYAKLWEMERESHHSR